MKAAVLGATGYAGVVLLRILAQHPEIEAVLPVSRSAAGTPLSELDPGMPRALFSKTRAVDNRCIGYDEAAAENPDVVFAALPPLASAAQCDPFYDTAVVIDLSADFRIPNPEVFERAYSAPLPRAAQADRAVYGLTELARDQLRTASVIANPGCYPTAALLPLVPVAQEGLIQHTVVINALSGISGAGRKAETNLLFVERSENAGAYKPGRTHRHWAEIQYHLERLAARLPALFTPHLVPMKQGLAVTTVAQLADDLGEHDHAAVQDCLADRYSDARFIRLSRDRIPETRQVRGSNRCDIGWRIEGRYLYLFSVIDNLWKGAAGQAVQNMNVRFGFTEDLGLPDTGEL